ncbi:hypothetical protein EYF80_056139 [Liparis tanakae]|uniref:Uncharacterized protein n=1 Tax=Liparis tanakae TaxID=230148 RepID=A0A4Z2EY23_9TELE|nr:hypothetical protein EYF80_056139 [Liparis tanakae]
MCSNAHAKDAFTWEDVRCAHSSNMAFPEVAEVALVAHQHDDDVAVRVVLQLLQPALGVFVRQVLGDVVDQEGADRPAVVAGRHGRREANTRRIRGGEEE